MSIDSAIATNLQGPETPEAPPAGPLIREQFPELDSWKVRIVATDLSTAMLDRARQGRYRQLEVNRGLSAPQLVKHFEREGLDWRLKGSIRNMVEFSQLNLLDSWRAFPLFDIVFLRNVLIYFDVDVKRAVLKKAREHPTPGEPRVAVVGDLTARVEICRSGRHVQC